MSAHQEPPTTSQRPQPPGDLSCLQMVPSFSSSLLWKSAQMIGIQTGRIVRPDNSFHPASSPLVCGMNARGRGRDLSRIPRFSRITGLSDSQSRASGSFSIPEHAPGIFHAEHHGTAEQQDCTDNRVRREWRDPSWAGKCSHRGAGRRQRRVLPSLPLIQRRAGA